MTFHPDTHISARRNLVDLSQRRIGHQQVTVRIESHCIRKPGRIERRKHLRGAVGVDLPNAMCGVLRSSVDDIKHTRSTTASPTRKPKPTSRVAKMDLVPSALCFHISPVTVRAA